MQYRMSGRHLGLLAMIIWGGAILALGLVSFEPYRLDEGAARGLLLNWSVVDNIASPIVIFGLPDFRALFFIPLGLYWSGSIIAAKVYTLMMAFSAILLLYSWSRKISGIEAALISSALLAISPLMITQVDAIGAGPYLLLIFGLGAWLDKTYRAAQRPLSGWFFLQLLAVGTSVTLHPAGLAYPLALMWRWYKDPTDARQKRHVLIGATLITTIVLIMRLGWPDIAWWNNPVATLGLVNLGNPLEEPSWIVGVLSSTLLLLVLWLERRALLNDLMGTMLLLSLLIGLAAADATWAMLALVLVLYRGVPRLIATNKTSMMGRYGVVMIVMLIVSMSFMLADKSYARIIQDGELSPEDQLIKLLAMEASDTKQPFRAASQWPARTMIACKRDVLPLPPPAKDGETLLKTIKGITHLTFNPYNPAFRELGRNIAQLGAATQTLALQQGGVIIKIRQPAKPAAQ
ncbi:MAG: hypothetical protein M3A44_01675 [Gammaproteobacteria bacterium]